MPLTSEYVSNLKEGYFDGDGILKSGFITRYSEMVAQNLRGMTSTQLRNFYNHVRTAGDVYGRTQKTSGDEKILINKIVKLQSIVTYRKGRRGVTIPNGFDEFILRNIEACGGAKEITQGFIPHFESVVGYFRQQESLGR